MYYASVYSHCYTMVTFGTLFIRTPSPLRTYGSYKKKSSILYHLYIKQHYEIIIKMVSETTNLT